MFYPPMVGYLLVTLVCIVLIVAHRKRLLGRNSAIGIRTKYTLASDTAWEEGHRAGVPYLYAMAAIAIIHAGGLAGIEQAGSTRVGHMLAVLGWVLIIVCAVFAAKAANSAARNAAE